jgi:hypothetical protein
MLKVRGFDKGALIDSSSERLPPLRYFFSSIPKGRGLYLKEKGRRKKYFSFLVPSALYLLP